MRGQKQGRQQKHQTKERLSDKWTVNKQNSLSKLDIKIVRDTQQETDLKVEGRNDALSLRCQITLKGSGLMLQAINFDVMCCHQHLC